MNFSFIWMSVGSFGICLYLALGLWQKGHAYEYNLHEIDHQIVIAKSELEYLKNLPSSSPGNIEDTYKRLYETTRICTRLIDAKSWIELINAKEAAQVTSALIPSRFVGVSMLSLKLSFSDVAVPEGYIKILRTMGNLQKVLPMEIKKIEGFDKNIDIAIDIYGLSRRV